MSGVWLFTGSAVKAEDPAGTTAGPAPKKATEISHNNHHGYRDAGTQSILPNFNTEV